ncbi:hypothetical protein BGZ68_003613, partial [Mortierella alpina]
VKTLADAIRGPIQSTFNPRKKFKQGETVEKVLKTQEDTFRTPSSNKTKLPRDTMTTAVDLARKKYNLSEAFDKVQFQAQLGKHQENIQKYKAAMVKDFDTVWKREVDAARKGKGISGASGRGGKGKGKGGESGGDEGDAGGGPSGGSQGDVNQEQLRTCTERLTHVMRSDFVRGEVGNFLRLAETSQREMTDMVFELATLAHKTTLLIASGDLYDQTLGHDQSVQHTFNIANALPAGFIFRDAEVDRTVSVAPLPPGLQQHIHAHQDKTAPRDDIVLLLSQDCLQYIKTRFLSPRAGGSGEGSSTGGGSGQGQASSDDGDSITSFDSQASTDLNHPCWLNVVNSLRTPATHNIT